MLAEEQAGAGCLMNDSSMRSELAVHEYDVFLQLALKVDNLDL